MAALDCRALAQPRLEQQQVLAWFLVSPWRQVFLLPVCRAPETSHHQVAPRIHKSTAAQSRYSLLSSHAGRRSKVLGGIAPQGSRPTCYLLSCLLSTYHPSISLSFCTAIVWPFRGG